MDGSLIAACLEQERGPLGLLLILIAVPRIFILSARTLISKTMHNNYSHELSVFAAGRSRKTFFGVSLWTVNELKKRRDRIRGLAWAVE